MLKVQQWCQFVTITDNYMRCQLAAIHPDKELTCPTLNHPAQPNPHSYPSTEGSRQFPHVAPSPLASPPP